MWFKNKHHNQPIACLVIDEDQAALITWCNDQTEQRPFLMHSYQQLPSAWFMRGAPWNITACTEFIHSSLHKVSHKPRIVCACASENMYEKKVIAPNGLSHAVIPPDKCFKEYAWHATMLSPTIQPSSYLVSGMPQYDILRLQLCAHKSGCTLKRITTLRASMQQLYSYCEHHGITVDTDTLHTDPTHDTSLLTLLYSPHAPEHNARLVLASLGLSLFERNKV